jgi:hypothetical protein
MQRNMYRYIKATLDGTLLVTPKMLGNFSATIKGVKWCRGKDIEDEAMAQAALGAGGDDAETAATTQDLDDPYAITMTPSASVGGYTLNAVAPELETFRFQPLNLSSEKTGFKVWFQIRLVPLHLGG